MGRGVNQLSKLRGGGGEGRPTNGVWRWLTQKIGEGLKTKDGRPKNGGGGRLMTKKMGYGRDVWPKARQKRTTPPLQGVFGTLPF